MNSKLGLKDLLIKDKNVLMRVDFNVPQDENGNITDDTRIQATLPSINFILKNGGKLILMSHLGNPKGKSDPKYSLIKVRDRLRELLNKPVLFCKDCIGNEAQEKVKSLKSGEVLLLENLRFHEAEENPEKDLKFAKEIANFGDVFINDAFGASHRKHSSIVEVPKFFPSTAAAGFLMDKEIEFLGQALSNPKKPFYAIIGGSKVSSKLGIIKTLLKKADAILIGGAMAYTFLKAKGLNIGKSLVEDELIDEAKSILKEANKKGVKIFLPIDHLITNDLKGNGTLLNCTSKEGIPESYYGVDIGLGTIKLFSDELKNGATVIWNGPLGIFEIPSFSKGTFAVAKILSSLKNALTIVGGGDSIAALKESGVIDKISHASTGGGASLEYLEYGTLPGIEVLTVKK